MSGISYTPKQSDVFENRYKFSTGVRVSRLDDSFLQERAKLNPIRQDLHKRLDLNKSFKTAKEFYDHAVSQRKHLSIGNNTTGGLEIKKDHIGFSLAPVQDYEATIPTKEEGFTIENRYFRNSPFNGAKFKDEDGQIISIKDANSSPWDRTEFDLQSERLTQKKDRTSIFYAGRPDTLERAELLGIDMFLNELATQKRGVVKNGDKIEFHYIVDSLTNPTAGLSKWRQRIPLAPQALDERASLKWEQEALKKLYASDEPLEVDFKGTKYQVLLRPMHVHNTVSCLGTYQFFNDKGRELENSINEASYENLINYYKNLENLPQRQKNFGDEIVKILESAKKKSTDIEVHRRVAMIDMLAKICNLPIAHHCKSVVDRTSGAASVSIVNQLVFDEKFLSSISSFDEILKNEEYKEYYLRAMQTQLSVSGDLRTAVDPSGRLNCKRLLPAFMWRSSPDTQAHGFLPLLPDRALKEFTVAQRIINFAKQIFAFLISPLTYCLLGLPVIKPTWIKHNKAFDLESAALSENGTRPLLEGPHNKRLKDSLTSSTIFGKKKKALNDFNIDVIDVVRKKAWPLFSLLSLKEQKELYPANLKNEGSFSLDLEELYTGNDSQPLDKDIERANYTFDGENVSFSDSQGERVHNREVYNKLKSKIVELSQNDQLKEKYLEEILTQRFLALVRTHLRKEHFVDLRPTELSYNFSSSKECVTVSIQAEVTDLFIFSEDEPKKLGNYNFTIRFPFDHKEKATVEYKKTEIV
jgi:hypothetical protein